MHLIALLVLSFVLGAPIQMSMTMPAPNPNCEVPAAQARLMLDATYDDFDQAATGAASWRTLMNSGCYTGAAKVIVSYLEAHKAQLTAEQTRTLYFHAGQVTALGGDDRASVPYFEKSRDASATADWNAYVDATVAFLKNDRDALAAARDAYAKVAKPGSPRLGVINGLLSCLGKPYKDGVNCRAGG